MQLILNRNFAGQKEMQEIFKVMKSKDLQPRLQYSAKLSFRMEELPRQAKAKGVHRHQTSIT